MLLTLNHRPILPDAGCNRFCVLAGLRLSHPCRLETETLHVNFIPQPPHPMAHPLDPAVAIWLFMHDPACIYRCMGGLGSVNWSW
jgi:hypothetical protein